MSTNMLSQNSGVPRARLKIGNACTSCRSKKVKCDGIRPVCSNCKKKRHSGESCTYGSDKHAQSPRPPPHAPTGVPTAHNSPSIGPETPYRQEIPKISSAGAGIFAGEVNAAIDARLGQSSGEKPMIPMTDAPLFGLLSRRQVTESSFHHMDNVLPPRKHADYLMEIYWRYIQPLEPFLEEEPFRNSYQALFAGSLLPENERIFVSTLNTVFALSTQLQECMQPEQREETSNTYFLRAWALLRPETIIWEPGSLEVIQCLLLMSRYLQNTNNPHQTWMAVGSAVRIAQSLGLNTVDTTSSDAASYRENRRKVQLWQCCVFLDRGVSWMLGRTSLVPLTDSSNGIGSMDGRSAYYFTNMLELYEISNHVQLSQTSTCNGNKLGGKLGLPGLYQTDDYVNTAMLFDSCFRKWESHLPPFLQQDIIHGDANNISHRQAIMLRLRFLHGRLILFRPMLARVCLSQSPSLAGTVEDQGLAERISRQCVSLCIESAQKMIALVHDNYKPEDNIGVVPWWYRVFYLHVAGTTLVAASLRAELFTPAVLQSWNTAMSTLRAHKHLSPFVQQCVTTFQTLSAKVSESHLPNAGKFPQPEGASNLSFQDFFQGMGLDTDYFFMGEDMSWLNNAQIP